MRHQALEKAIKDDRLRILLVEDDAFDAMVTQNYLRRGRKKIKLHIAHSGGEAFDFLNRKGKYKNEKTPDLILVDIGLPDMDGREILSRLNADNKFNRIPKVILTGQDLPGNPVDRYNLYEHAYMNKWANMADFISLLKAISDSHHMQNS